MDGPIGAARTDQLFGMLASVLANSNRSKKTKPYTAEQFIPKWDRDAPPDRRPEQSPEQMLSSIRRAHRAMGG